MREYNTWSPSIYKSECPTDWTAERERSYRNGGGCKHSYGNKKRGDSKTATK